MNWTPLKKDYNIAEFSKYANIGMSKSRVFHLIDYEEHKNIRQSSKPLQINFHILSIHIDGDKENSYLYIDRPGELIEWNLQNPLSGYQILIAPQLLNQYAWDLSFTHYNSNEGLSMNKDEETLLLDLFEKAFMEYKKEVFSEEIILGYAIIILCYIDNFYIRQFETRSKLYSKVVTDFYQYLEIYYEEKVNLPELPSVTYFAQKLNLSPNYFGDVIKHFTGIAPQEHIHEYLIRVSKNKLSQSTLTISEIGYSLGFNYPTYFTRFFKKETGITPTEFRNKYSLVK